MAIALPYGYAPRGYQLPAWQYLENGGDRAALVWHRRAGKDLFSINWTAVASQQRVGLYWHILPTYEQGRKIVWNGMTADGVRFIDYFPEEIVKRKRDDMMFMEMNNGSIYQVVGTDDPDRLVGSNPVGCVFSEYSLQNPAAWDLIRPILNENGGWALFIYTARGRNHGHSMYEAAKTNPRWFAELLTVDDTRKPLVDPRTRELKRDKDRKPIFVPVISQESIQDDRDMGMDEETVKQEYWCSFDAPLSGSYYGDLMVKVFDEGRIRDVPYNPKLWTETWWDLGIDDCTAIWFVQRDELGNFYFFDFEHGNNKSFEYWLDVVKGKGYSYDLHIGPHDIENREYSNGRSRRDFAATKGFRFSVANKLDIADGVNAARVILPRSYFDKNRCSHGVEALRQHRKKYDKKARVYLKIYEKDWTSDPADAFRTGATLSRDKVVRNPARQRLAQSDYDVLNTETVGDYVQLPSGLIMPTVADSGDW